MSDDGPIIGINRTDQISVATILYEKIVNDSEIKKMEQTIFPLISEDPQMNLVLDFTYVKYVSSSALGFILRIRKRLAEHGSRLVICCVQSTIPSASNDTYVYEIFKIVKLDQIFEMYESVGQAVKALSTQQ